MMRMIRDENDDTDCNNDDDDNYNNYNDNNNDNDDNNGNVSVLICNQTRKCAQHGASHDPLRAVQGAITA